MEDLNSTSPDSQNSPQNTYSNSPPPNLPPNKPEDNKNRNLIIAAVAVLVLAVAAYFIFFNKKKVETKELDTTTMVKDSAKTAVVIDSAAIFRAVEKAAGSGEGEYDEEGYERISESYVISNEAYLRNAPSASDATMVRSLKFGERVYVLNEQAVNGYTKVYLSKPTNAKMPQEQEYYLTESVVVSQYQFDEYKKFFSIAPFSTLASKTKKLILDEDSSNGTSYELTQNSDRAKYALSYGDFDKDGLMDVAIVLDNNEKQTSRLLVICTNKATKEPYLGFAENYTDKIRINTFKKGASVFMNSEDFMASPNDGIIVTGEDIKLAIIYDNGLQKFKSYFQE